MSSRRLALLLLVAAGPVACRQGGDGEAVCDEARDLCGEAGELDGTCTGSVQPASGSGRGPETVAAALVIRTWARE